MKRTFKIIAVSILILISFRGIIFRFIIKYNEIGTRPEMEITSLKLIKKIENKLKNKEIDLKTIAEISNKITNEELKFTSNRASNNPNELINTHQANCVGYSAMFNSIANYLIKRNRLQDEIEAKHIIGQLELFGINLHQYFESPFFRDHDFNEISNRKTGEKFWIDPSISDCLRINRVVKNE